LRGIIAGILAHVFTWAALFLLFFFLKPFIWHAFSNAPYPSPSESISPDSIEWLVVQAMNFISWVAAGITVGRWSPQNTKSGLLTIVGCLFILAFFAKVPNTESTLSWHFGF
jgi:hypothetical protein